MNYKFNDVIPRGTYHVGDKKFSSKFQALSYSDATGIHPSWNYHDELFSSFDWTKEPPESLEYYYLQRCQQIRDSYDWVVLHYSGGSDSHNILSNFWKNNIHIDEIIVSHPIEYFEKHTTPDLSIKSSNAHNEWFHTLKPDLDWIAKNLPKTKITIYDYTNDMLEFKVDQDWINHCGEHINPNLVNRINRYTKIQTLDVYDRYRVGHVYGIDKPLVFKENDHWYFAFLDSLMAIQSSQKPVYDNHTHVNVEFFYWTPQLPEMLIKQAHLIKNFFEQNPKYLSVATNKKKTAIEKDLERDIVRSITYPYWRRDVYQHQKTSNVFFKEFDQWFFKFASESAQSRWWDGYNFVTSTINEKWFNKDELGRKSGLVGFWSKWHRLD